jgi:hypothetical protein
MEELMPELITLNEDNFSKFLSVMSILRQTCTDLIVKEGRICQLTDRRSAIYEIDMSSLIKESTLLLSGIGIKADLLSTFKQQNSDIDLIVDEQTYIFQDNASQLIFQKPQEKYLTNSYIPEEQLYEKLKIEEGQIFHLEIKKFLIDRLASFAKGLSATMVKLEFNGDKVVFIVSNSDKNVATEAKFVKATLDQEVTALCVFPIQPFLAGEKIDLECFYREDHENLLLKFSTKIGEGSDSINIVTWSMSKIITETE